MGAARDAGGNARSFKRGQVGIVVAEEVPEDGAVVLGEGGRGAAHGHRRFAQREGDAWVGRGANVRDIDIGEPAARDDMWIVEQFQAVEHRARRDTGCLEGVLRFVVRPSARPGGDWFTQ